MIYDSRMLLYLLGINTPSFMTKMSDALVVWDNWRFKLRVTSLAD